MIRVPLQLQQAVGLFALLILAKYTAYFHLPWSNVAFILFFAAAFEHLCLFAIRKKLDFFSFSSLSTAMGVMLMMTTAQLWIYAVVIGLGLLQKHILVIGKRHFFNPSNFALLFGLFFFYDDAHMVLGQLGDALWFVAETLLEVETDKTAVEVPALQDGVLVEILAEPDAIIGIGVAIARIEVAESAGLAVAGAAEEEKKPASTPPEPRLSLPDRTTHAQIQPSGQQVRASPAARRMAKRNGIALASLEGTGRRGRVSGRDVARALESKPPKKTRLRTASVSHRNASVNCRSGHGRAMGASRPGLFCCTGFLTKARAGAFSGGSFPAMA